jgi:hypothetical protein
MFPPAGKAAPTDINTVVTGTTGQGFLPVVKSLDPCPPSAASRAYPGGASGATRRRRTKGESGGGEPRVLHLGAWRGRREGSVPLPPQVLLAYVTQLFVIFSLAAISNRVY